MLLHEFREVIPPTLFFFVGFNLVLLTKRLFLQQYFIEYAGFFIATTGALIVGKVLQIADTTALPATLRLRATGLPHSVQDSRLHCACRGGAPDRSTNSLPGRGRRSGRRPFHRALARRVQLVAVHCDADVDIRPVPRLGHGKRSQQSDR